MKTKYERISNNDTSQALQKKTFSEIKEFLIKNAEAIQKLATQHHKTLLGDKKFRSEFTDKYQQNYIKVVEAFAQNLEQKDIKKGIKIFKKLGETLAKDSVEDGFTLEEAVDGIVFLKQATWEILKKEKLLDPLSIKDFYQLNQNIGTYCDTVASKLAFTYHEEYVRNLEHEVAERKKADKLKDEFIGIASHELKTPVSHAITFTITARGKKSMAAPSHTSLKRN